MRNLIQQHKNLFLFGVIFALLLVGYFLFFRGNTPPVSTEGTLTVTNLAPEGQVGSDLVALLLRLQSLKLDTNILKNAAFRSLSDFGQPIPPEPSGRTNPFAPVGRD